MILTFLGLAVMRGAIRPCTMVIARTAHQSELGCSIRLVVDVLTF